MVNNKKTNKKEEKRTLTKAEVEALEAEGEVHTAKELRRERALTTEEELRKEIASLEKSKLSKFSTRNMFLAVGIIIIIIGIAVYFIFHIKIIPIIIVSIGLLYVLAGLLSSTRYTGLLIDQKKLELELLTMPEIKPREKRAEKLFKGHQIEVQKYYDQNLRHNAWIFFAGLVCIVLGFVIIGGTIYLVFIKPLSSPGIGLDEKIVAACLGAVGGILSNFIAFVYLNMFSKTLSSLTKSHNRLVATHYLHIGNFLVSKIENVGLREKTLAAIASKLGMLQELTAEESDGGEELIKPPK
jgi:small-conductance mechanosensitive channel